MAGRGGTWQSMRPCQGRWIASFLNDHPLRHCEARSAVAIYVPVLRLQWIASVIARSLRRGNHRNDGTGVQ